MSTFNGVVAEFPEIRVDYFHKVPESPPPLAYFLSHIHSDHCKGLESYLAPVFIYCSSATKELLLKLERSSSRKNYDNGFLEAKQFHYKHLRKFLRPIPLNTPTHIQLTLRKAIRVTLLDANHCPGAVMFLVEDHSKSVLITGDIRAEEWWCRSLARHPIMLPYACGLRRMKKIYLDTTHANKSKKSQRFPDKAVGMQKLLVEVAKYPPETVFHINCWTLGYEAALSALAAAFSTRIHADRYKIELYSALSNCTGDVPHTEVSFFNGHDVGSTRHLGFLTAEENVRFHTCNPWCPSLLEKEFVRIIPCISDGVFEIGAQPPTRKIRLDNQIKNVVDGILYPFARHSSYQELCTFVECFKPDEVYPCVVDKDSPANSSMKDLFGPYCATDSFCFDKEVTDAHRLSRAGESFPPPESFQDHFSQESEAVSNHPSSIPTSLEEQDPISQPIRSKRRPLGSSHASITVAVTRIHGVKLEGLATTADQELKRRKTEEQEGPGFESDRRISISDEEFGSQTSILSDPEEMLRRLEHRKEAYLAAKSSDPNAWASLSLLSAGGRFQDEEEL